MTVFAVALGGAVGAVLRYFAGTLLTFPLATLFVNVVGSFLIGLAFVLLATQERYVPFIMTGVLGGFTTYSTFSLDALRLIEGGQFGGAMFYVVGTLVLCLLGCACGLWLGRMA